MLADSAHRLHHIICEEPDFRTFHSLATEDPPILPAIMVYCALQTLGITNFIFTARHESNRQLTEAWARVHGVNIHGGCLLMRPNDDNAPSPILKRRFLQMIRDEGYHVLCAFEDHPGTVNMYRESGVWCWAADPKHWQHKFGEALAHR